MSSSTQPASTLQVASTTQSVSLMQPSSTLQGTSTAQLGIDAQSSSWLQNSGLGAGVTSISAPRCTWPGFGVGSACYHVPSYSSLGSGVGTISFGVPSNNTLPGASSSGLSTATTSTSICPINIAPAYNRPSTRLTLRVHPSPPKAAATQLIPIQMLTSPAPLSSPVVQPRTGPRHVSTPSPTVSPTHSPAVSPAPHYSPVSPPLAGPRGNSVAPVQTWSNNTVTGTTLPSQITPAAHPVVGSCQVSFGSRAVRPGPHNNSLLNSTPASPSLPSSPGSSSPSSPSSASSPAPSPPAKAPPHGHTSTSSRMRSAISHSSPSAQHTPSAPLIPSLGGLLQPATAGTTQQSSQSQSTGAAAPHSSIALMRSASSKQRNLSQASISKVNNKEIVSFYLLIFSCMYMDVS